MERKMFNIVEATSLKAKLNKFVKEKSNRTEPIKHPFYSKESGHYSNVAYLLLNCDMPHALIQEGLFSVQYEMHKKVKPNVTFVVNFFDKCKEIENPLPDLLDMKQLQAKHRHMRPPFNDLNRCRYFIPSFIDKDNKASDGYKFSNKFNLSNIIFLNILNNRDLGYKVIVKGFLANYFKLPELSNQQFNNFNELSDILLSINNEQSELMLDFINKYKDILFFEDESCQIFKVKNKDDTSALIELDNIVMEQQSYLNKEEKNNQNSLLSKLFWGDDLMFLYHQENYTYFFNDDSNDDLLNQFIIQLIEVTAKYLNSQTLPFFKNSVMYCLYNCDNKKFIENLVLYPIKKVNHNFIQAVNRNVDVLSIHYINNEANHHELKNIIEEHIIEKDVNKYLDGYAKPVNSFLGNTSSLLIYPLLDNSKNDIYLKQVEYIYHLLLQQYGKKNTSQKNYYVMHQINDYKTNAEKLDSLSNTNIPCKLGDTFCFDLGGYGLIRYEMFEYDCMNPD